MNFNDIRFRHDPYPIAFAQNVLPKSLYDKLTDNFPATESLRRASNMGENKFLLTEFDGPSYYSLIESHPAWRELYDYVKSKEFVEKTLALLCSAGIDQGLRGIEVVSAKYYDNTFEKYAGKVKRKFKQLLPTGAGIGHLTSRFEFSALHGAGGSHLPHTDAPRKVISMVLSMMKEGEWNPVWGGGTAVCKPRDMTRNFNYMNKYIDFSEVEVLETFPFIPNGCVIFVKTFNSWHTVMPYKADPSVVRKSIVINIDYPHAVGAQNANY